jgi:dTDP-4-dehydrorhamnose reductase
MKILVTGKTGQLGRSIRKIVENTHQKHEYIFTSRAELDFSIIKSISSYFQYHQFDLVINCAAYTAVDKAEEEKELTGLINHEALKQICEILIQNNTKLIHISTDYVFDGNSKKPYKEDDIPNPINFYGKTKLEGEKVVQKIMPKNAIIIRAGWIFSEFGGNFLDTILKLGKEREELNIIYDQIGSPTYAMDLAEAILTIIDSKKYNSEDQETEIYHYSNEGSCSWYDFAKVIFKLANIKCKINPIKSDEYVSSSKRPSYSIMSKDKIKKNFNLVIPYYQDSVNQCIAQKLE